MDVARLVYSDSPIQDQPCTRVLARWATRARSEQERREEDFRSRLATRNEEQDGVVHVSFARTNGQGSVEISYLSEEIRLERPEREGRDTVSQQDSRGNNATKMNNKYVAVSAWPTDNDSVVASVKTAMTQDHRRGMIPVHRDMRVDLISPAGRRGCKDVDRGYDGDESDRGWTQEISHSTISAVQLCHAHVGSSV